MWGSVSRADEENAEGRSERRARRKRSGVAALGAGGVGWEALKVVVARRAVSSVSAKGSPNGCGEEKERGPEGSVEACVYGELRPDGAGREESPMRSVFPPANTFIQFNDADKLPVLHVGRHKAAIECRPDARGGPAENAEVSFN